MAGVAGVIPYFDVDCTEYVNRYAFASVPSPNAGAPVAPRASGVVGSFRTYCGCVHEYVIELFVEEFPVKKRIIDGGYAAVNALRDTCVTSVVPCAF